MPRKPGTSPKAVKEDVFVIKEIIDYEKRGSAEFFKVLWDGYGPDDATWEPLSNFFDPLPEMRKKMEQLRKAGGAANGSISSSATSPRSAGAVKGKRPSSAVSTGKGAAASGAGKGKKKRRTGDVSPSPKSSPAMQRAAKVKEPEEEEESSEEDEEESESEGVAAAKAPSKGKQQQRAVEVKVKTVKRGEEDNELQVVLEFNRSPDRRSTVSIEEARRKYPQELITFLLGRIQFRGSSASRFDNSIQDCYA